MRRLGSKRQSRGSSLLMSLSVLTLLLVGCMSVVSLSSTSSMMSYRAWQKSEADSLAEAGVNAMYAQLSTADPNTKLPDESAIPQTLMKSLSQRGPADEGTYSAVILDKRTLIVDGKQQTRYTILGTGISSRTNTRSEVRASVTVSSGGKDLTYADDAAIVSNGDVVMTDDSFTKDFDGLDRASVFANKAIINTSAVVTIDGTASALLPSNIVGTAKAIVPLSSPIKFPSDSEMAEWKAKWEAQSRQKTPSFPNGNVRTSSVKCQSPVQLTGPCYINGDLNVTGGGVLTIDPDPDASKPVVVYVKGKVMVNNGSQLINNGIILVSEGSQTYNGKSDVYRTSPYADCGMFSFSKDLTKAISIRGESGVARVGVVYAANGGVTMDGLSTFDGCIRARGKGCKVIMSGGSSVVYHGPDTTFLPQNMTYVMGRLTDWYQVR